MEGLIFDIQRFALNDGPGIRTTVFFKGCKLRCVWCSNPESQSRKKQLSYKRKECTNCLKCIAVCKNDVLKNNAGVLKIDYKLCDACGKCIDTCSQGALKIYGWYTTPELILAEVEKDLAYYKNSGGGLTISGGEPLDQPEFLAETLKLAKKKNIHTCIETSGNAPLEVFQSIIPLVDLFLFDYKVSDPYDFKKLVKVNPDPVLRNLDFMGNSNSKIILRCPVIPGLNDKDDHFKKIAEIFKKYSSVKKVEVLPCHNWGAYKYSELGMDLFPMISERVHDDTVKHWISKISEYGCENISKA